MARAKKEEKKKNTYVEMGIEVPNTFQEKDKLLQLTIKHLKKITKW